MPNFATSIASGEVFRITWLSSFVYYRKRFYCCPEAHFETFFLKEELFLHENGASGPIQLLKCKQKSLLQMAAAMFNEKMNSNPDILCIIATTEKTGGVLLRNLFYVWFY